MVPRDTILSWYGNTKMVIQVKREKPTYPRPSHCATAVASPPQEIVERNIFSNKTAESI